MISIESGKKYGKLCVYIRFWDGYDKPAYYPVMDISEEEVEFKGGRFERCLGQAKSGDVTQNLYLEIKQLKNELTNIVNWINGTIEGQWSFDIEENIFVTCWRFSFTNEEDAVLFKLTWSASSSMDALDDLIFAERG